MKLQSILEKSDKQNAAEIAKSCKSHQTQTVNIWKRVFAITRDLKSSDKKINATVKEKLGFDIREEIQHVYQGRNLVAAINDGTTIMTESQLDSIRSTYNAVLFVGFIGSDNEQEALEIILSGEAVRPRLKELAGHAKPAKKSTGPTRAELMEEIERLKAELETVTAERDALASTPKKESEPSEFNLVGKATWAPIIKGTMEATSDELTTLSAIVDTMADTMADRSAEINESAEKVA
jgi:hypothetical protein